MINLYWTHDDPPHQHGNDLGSSRSWRECFRRAAFALYLCNRARRARLGDSPSNGHRQRKSSGRRAEDDDDDEALLQPEVTPKGSATAMAKGQDEEWRKPKATAACALLPEEVRRGS